MGNRLRDKVAVVTGAGRGIGRGIALLMASEGAAVVVNDLGVNVDGRGQDTSAADETVAAITAAGGRAVANYDSVADFAAAARIIDTAVQTFGRIDILVNNAGILRDRMIFNMSRGGVRRGRRRASEGHVQLQPPRRGAHAPAEGGPHHQHVVDLGTVRQHRPGELRSGQGRHRRVHARGVARPRPLRHHGQRHRAGGGDAHDRDGRRCGAPGALARRRRRHGGGGAQPVAAAAARSRRRRARSPPTSPATRRRTSTDRSSSSWAASSRWSTTRRRCARSPSRRAGRRRRSRRCFRRRWGWICSIRRRRRTGHERNSEAAEAHGGHREERAVHLANLCGLRGLCGNVLAQSAPSKWLAEKRAEIATLARSPAHRHRPQPARLHAVRRHPEAGTRAGAAAAARQPRHGRRVAATRPRRRSRAPATTPRPARWRCAPPPCSAPVWPISTPSSPPSPRRCCATISAWIASRSTRRACTAPTPSFCRPRSSTAAALRELVAVASSMHMASVVEVGTRPPRSPPRSSCPPPASASPAPDADGRADPRARARARGRRSRAIATVLLLAEVASLDDLLPLAGVIDAAVVGDALLDAADPGGRDGGVPRPRGLSAPEGL